MFWNSENNFIIWSMIIGFLISDLLDVMNDILSIFVFVQSTVANFPSGSQNGNSSTREKHNEYVINNIYKSN